MLLLKPGPRHAAAQVASPKAMIWQFASLQIQPFCMRWSSHSQPATATATIAPANCATMNAGTPAGAIPANVLDSERAIVTAGLANEVEAVNQ